MSFNKTIPAPECLNFEEKLRQGMQNLPVLSWPDRFSGDTFNPQAPENIDPFKKALDSQDYFDPETSISATSFEDWMSFKFQVAYDDIEKEVAGLSKEQLTEYLSSYIFTELCWEIYAIEIDESGSIGEFNKSLEVPLTAIKEFIRRLIGIFVYQIGVSLSLSSFDRAVMGFYMHFGKVNVEIDDEKPFVDNSAQIDESFKYIQDFLKIDNILYTKLMELLDETVRFISNLNSSGQDDSDLGDSSLPVLV